MKRRVVLLLIFVALVVGTWQFTRDRRNALVVYCAHDSIYSDAILREFTRATGIAVDARYDTEATKSLGLVELIAREKDAPRCDVFWNNELPGTLDLAARGLLAPYRGTGWKRMPEKFRDPEACWTGFASRLRVVIYNTNAVTLREGETPPLPTDLKRFAIAKPLYGTTLTHYSVMWSLWGSEETQSWHHAWRTAGVRELNGNAAVKDAVASGVCDAGFTDTDDFFEAKDAGSPVAMRPVRLGNGATICIPNTVSIVKGTQREDDAQRLADFLLSEETELALSRSKSRQIPLGPVSPEKLPAEVRELQPWAADGIPLNGLLEARSACLAWLKREYVQ